MKNISKKASKKIAKIKDFLEEFSRRLLPEKMCEEELSPVWRRSTGSAPRQVFYVIASLTIFMSSAAMSSSSDDFYPRDSESSQSMEVVERGNVVIDGVQKAQNEIGKVNVMVDGLANETALTVEAVTGLVDSTVVLVDATHERLKKSSLFSRIFKIFSSCCGKDTTVLEPAEGNNAGVVEE
jgi:hypothetical protein